MNAKVRWVIDLSGIYSKEKVTSKKIPAQVPAKSSIVGSASRLERGGQGVVKI